MEQELWQSEQPVLADDLKKDQSSLERAILSRFTDSFSAGILEGTLNQFAITVNINTAKVDVGTGVAYDPSGQRISISSTSPFVNAYTVGSIISSGTPALDGVSNGPLTTTDNGLGGYTPTPQSSGCTAISLFAGSVNYLFIAYQQVVDPTVFTLQNLTNLRLFTSASDGYQIQVVASATVVTNPNTLNPDTSKFLYIGYVDFTNSPSPLSLGNINTSGLTFYTLENYRHLGMTPDLAESDKTTTYALNQTVSFDDHIKAVGSLGHITPANPHGMTLADLGFAGVTVAQHEEQMHSSGITGSNISSLNSLVNSVSGAASPPTYGLDTFIVYPLLTGQTLEVEGVTIDPSVATLGSSHEFFWVDLTGNVLPNGTYTIYADSISQTLKMASTLPSVVTSTVNAVSGLNVTGLTFIISVNGGSPLTTTFTGINPISRTSIISQINAILGSTAIAAVSGNYISVTAAPLSSVQILSGTANAALGFTGGAIITGVGGTYRKLVGSTITTDIVQDPSVLPSLANFPLWEVTFTYGLISPGPGPKPNFTSVADLRVFGNTNTTDLSHDSATDTFDIDHNVDISGNLNVAGVISGRVTSLEGGISGEIPYQSASNVTSFTAVGNVSQVLTSAGGGSPVWEDPSGTLMAQSPGPWICSPTSVRSLSTTYTNGTTKPIFLNAQFTGGSNGNVGDSGSITMGTPSAPTLPTYVVASATSSSAGTAAPAFTLTAIIPAGYAYSLAAGNIGLGNVTEWQ